MRRILLRIAYDGTDYVGWQKQDNGTAVEEVLNNALGELTGEDIAVIGASRTDSGVHAMDNVAVFDTGSRIPADKFCLALNRYLPNDIVIQSSCEVEPDFHPRYRECRKTYEYSVYNAIVPNPLMNRYTYFVHHFLDIDAMNRAAGYLTGEHDFASFCSAGAQVKTTVREIFSIECIRYPVNEEQAVYAQCDIKRNVVMRADKEQVVDARADKDQVVDAQADKERIAGGTAQRSFDACKIVIRITGSGFLYNMVRIIAGTLIQIGQGMYPPDKMKDIIEACDRTQAGPTAPPQGLTLKRILYSGQEDNP